MKPVFFLLYFLLSPLAALPNPTTLHPRQNAPPPPLRDVYLIADVDMEAKAISTTTGKPIFGLHTSLQIDGTTLEGPLRVEVGFNQYAMLQLRAFDFGVAQSGQAIGFWGVSNSRRYVRLTGQTTVTNAEIIDHQTGTGLLAQVWNQNPHYQRGTGSPPNTGIDLVQRLTSALNLTVEPSMALIYTNGEEYYTSHSDTYEQMIDSIWSMQQLNGSATDQWVRVFDVVTNPTAPALTMDNQNASPGGGTLTERQKRSENPLAFNQAAWYTDAVSQPEINNLPPPDTRKLPTIQEEAKSAVAPFQNTLAQKGAAGVVTTAEVTIGRAFGVVFATYLISEGVAEALGAAVGPIFVLLDMVNGQWVSAAMCAVGVVLGTAVALLLAGPVGWIFGAVLGSLFAILPAIWHKPHVANINDKQGIVQYKFFGDSTHTGNEQCRSLGNENCTAVFGPGVLSLVFGWNNFDSVAFLIQYNQGYAITLPELASQFYNIDDPANTGDGSDQIATLTCGNKKGHSNAFGGWDGDDFSKCNNPTFSFNRALVTLPVLNETADKIYDRIIPNPGGDCKIINNAANNLNVPEYNLTITGQPVAIACNLSATEVVDGTIIPLDPTSNQTPTNVSSANSSTDGLAGHQISVPAPVPFASLLNSTSAICLNGLKAGVLCFPGGRYDIQRGTLGFLTSGVDTLTMPAGSSLRWNEIGPSLPHTGASVTVMSFAINQTANDPSFARMIAAASTIMNMTLPDSVPVPPVVCLFTEKDRNGDVRCYGPGGGPLEPDIVNRAQSIGLHGNATAEIYAQEYGDAGGASVTADILDLTDQIYGESNFNQKIVALRVCDGSCAAGTA